MKSRYASYWDNIRWGGSVCIFAIAFLLASPVLAANIEYNGNGADLQNAPDPTSTPNSLFPGTTATPISSNNTVSIDYSAGTNPVRVFGGISNTESSIGNTVNLIQGTVTGRIYGGYGGTVGNAEGNKVNISGGKVGDRAVGGHSINGNSLNNSVIMSSGEVDYLFGGTSGNAASVASGNSVTFVNGTVNQDIIGGSAALTGTATDNNVFIHGGLVKGNAFGGNSSTGIAIGNSLTMSGGTVDLDVGGGVTNGIEAKNNQVTLSGGAIVGGFVYGGSSWSNTAGGQVSGNQVYIDDAAIRGPVYGGFSQSQPGSPGTVSNNHVYVRGGDIGSQNVYDFNASVIGGIVLAGDATGNSVNISGGSFTGDIYGGAVQKDGNATNNTVSLAGLFNLGNSILYGGATAQGITGDYFTGNTLNINGFRGSVKGTRSFENYNFFLPASITNGGTVLNITGGTPTDLVNTNVAITGIESGASLTPGAVITLIDSTQNTYASANATNVRQGFSLLYDFDLSTASGALTATVRNMQTNPQSKVFGESWLAGLAFTTQGADLIEGQGMFLARRAAAEKRSGPAVFATVAGSHLRNNSGSHIDVDGFSILTGLAWNACPTPGYLTLGAFFEAGWGNYDSYNDFANFASVRGSGDTNYYGGGILGRLDLPGGFYAEASARAGRVSTDFNSNDLRDPLGRAAWYDGGSAYYGAHAGLGYVWKPVQKLDIDLFTKYLWTHQNSGDVNIYGDPIHFSAADSQRWRTGARLSYAVTPCFSPYIGAAFEYEFDGKARATAYGINIDAPSLKGGTGIGELGVTYKPIADRGFFADVGVQGYVGKRQGVTGRLQVGWKF